MLRNLNILKGRPFLPTRVWRKKTGPGDSSRTASGGGDEAPGRAGGRATALETTSKARLKSSATSSVGALGKESMGRPSISPSTARAPSHVEEVEAHAGVAAPLLADAEGALDRRRGARGAPRRSPRRSRCRRGSGRSGRSCRAAPRLGHAGALLDDVPGEQHAPLRVIGDGRDARRRPAPPTRRRRRPGCCRLSDGAGVRWRAARSGWTARSPRATAKYVPKKARDTPRASAGRRGRRRGRGPPRRGTCRSGRSPARGAGPEAHVDLEEPGRHEPTERA